MRAHACANCVRQVELTPKAPGCEFESRFRVVVLVNQMMCIGHHLFNLHLGGAVVTDCPPLGRGYFEKPPQ